MEMTMKLDRNELRTRADRADVLIAWASIIGLAVLMLVQLMEKAA
jgi:hypothetical protein